MFLILLACVILCAGVIYLPYSAGLTHIEKNHHVKSAKKEKETKAPQYDGYVPPDEEIRLQEEAKNARASALKEKLTVTAEDMPLRIRLNQDSVLRKRQEHTISDGNPNTYDYDLDELIKEETVGAAQKAQAELYSHEKIGGDKEAMVWLYIDGDFAEGEVDQWI